DHGGRQHAQIAIANIGRGPAVRLAIAYHEFALAEPGHLFGSGAVIDMGPGESDSVDMYLGVTMSDQANRRLIDDLPEPALATGFEDVIGNRYRWIARPGGHGRLEISPRGSDEP